MEIKSSAVCLTQVLTRQVAEKENKHMENGKIRWHMDFSPSFPVVIHSLCSFLLLTAFCYTQEWKSKTLGRSESREYRTRSRVAALPFLPSPLLTSSLCFSPPWTLQMKQKRMLLILADRRRKLQKKLTLPQNEKCNPCNNDRTPWILRGISHVAKAVFRLGTFYSYSPSISERVNHSWPFQMWGKKRES